MGDEHTIGAKLSKCKPLGVAVPTALEKTHRIHRKMCMSYGSLPPGLGNVQGSTVSCMWDTCFPRTILST